MNFTNITKIDPNKLTILEERVSALECACALLQSAGLREAAKRLKRANAGLYEHLPEGSQASEEIKFQVEDFKEHNFLT